MSDRVEILRSTVDGLLANADHGWVGFVRDHMIAVANFAALLAEKRGLDPQIATMIGLMHDIHTAMTGNRLDHALLGSQKARVILTELGIVDDDELEIICHAISKHSKKRKVHDEYSELIKDADVLSHYYDNTTYPVMEKDRERLEAVKIELGIGQ